MTQPAPPRPGDHALSLWQPRASLIALRVKWIETRSWSTSYRGPIIIHAAKRVTGRPGDREILGDYETERDRAGLLLRSDRLSHPYRLPLGAAVARANLTDVVPMVEPGRGGIRAAAQAGTQVLVVEDGRLMLGPRPWLPVTDQLPYGHFEPGRFAWLLGDIAPISPEIPMRGRQGLWRLPTEGPCVGGDYCGRTTNGWFEAGSHGPGFYCGWCGCLPTDGTPAGDLDGQA